MALLPGDFAGARRVSRQAVMVHACCIRRPIDTTTDSHAGTRGTSRRGSLLGR